MNDNLPPESADEPDPELEASRSSISQMDPQLEALLNFTPVPRKYKRANAWTPALQRRFIIKLAETGSPAKAADALGKERFGIEKVYKSEGAESFREAWEKAIALFEERDAERQAAERGQWLDVRPPAGTDHRSPGPKRTACPGDRRALEGEEDDDEAYDIPHEEKLGLLQNIILKFLRKVEAEREARLKGEVVAADFYLRQVTFIEVAFDMMSEGLGLNGWDLLSDFRRGGHGIFEIAETPMSRTLDDKRRALWAKMAENQLVGADEDESRPQPVWGTGEDGSGRPEHPPERYLEHYADHSIEPLEYVCGGEEGEEQRAVCAAACGRCGSAG